MDDAFDTALIAAAMDRAAAEGWPRVTVAAAARDAGLALDTARRRFPTRAALLLRLGALADQAALAPPLPEGTPRERLFDLLMRRFDALAPYRTGIAALLRGLPADPLTALLLAGATSRSMAWMLAGAGLDRAGPFREAGLAAVWAYAARAFLRDESADLAATMAALDRGLEQAERWAGRIPGGEDPPPAPKPFPELPPLPAEAPIG